MINLKIDKKGFLILIFIIVNVLIPKAGIKLMGIPITMGNILFMILFFKYFLWDRGILRTKLYTIGIIVLFGMIYWFIIISVGYFLNQSEIHPMYTITNTISYAFSLVVYPVIFMILTNAKLDIKMVEKYTNIIKVCIIITMLYAVLQFVLGIGRVDIPGVTVNYSDYIAAPNDWWLKKSNGINSAGASKIVSTFQNGNIYGVNLLLLFPVVFELPITKLFKTILFVLFFAVIFLTSSRAAFLGLIFYIIVLIIEFLKKRKLMMNRTFMKALLFALCIMFSGVIVVIAQKGYYYNRLITIFDSNTLISATGRTNGFIGYLNWICNLNNIHHFIFGSFGINHGGWAYEMLYCTLIIMGGIVGFLFFIIPICVVLYRLKNHKSYLAKGIYNGIIVFLFVAIVEGAYWLIPTAINFWTILSFGYIVANNEQDLLKN